MRVALVLAWLGVMAPIYTLVFFDDRLGEGRQATILIVSAIFFVYFHHSWKALKGESNVQSRAKG